MSELFHNIFVPVDFSEYSHLALRYASALAMECQARLVVYHSVPDLEQISSYLEGHYIQTVTETLLTNGREKLEDFCSKIVPASVEHTMRLSSGSRAEMIVKLANEECADLIVMGTHGYSGYQRFLLGSVTNKVLHTTSIPVFTICKPSHNFIESDIDHPVSIRRILCAVDFDPNNQKIVQLAAALGNKYKSEIDFLHVTRTIDGVDWFKKEDRAMQKLRELVAPIMKDVEQIRLLVETGEPVNEILKTIERQGIDLVIMGHHTRRPVEEYLLGSVTKRVIPDAACPVLVVRSEADLLGSVAESISYNEMTQSK